MSFRIRCGTCGAVHYAGDGHQCMPRTDVKNPAPSPKLETSPKTSPKHTEAASPKIAMTGAQRNYRWREKNRDRYNASQRELMQRRCAK